MSFIILAFCRAHVRRDFLDAARNYPDLQEWALYWVQKIGEFYYINNQRCKEFDQNLPIQWQSASFQKQHEKLVGKMNVMAEERDAFVDAYDLDDPDTNLLSEVKYKIFTSLHNHWKGRSVFVEHPEAKPHLIVTSRVPQKGFTTIELPLLDEALFTSSLENGDGW